MKAHRETSRVLGRRVVTDTHARYPDLASVYADNALWVYRMILNRVGNRPDAEDLTTEVFLAALRPLRLTATVAEVRGYLRATVRTVLSTYWREPMGSETLSIDDIPDLPQNAEQSVRATPQLVDRVLAALPDNYRQILELRFLQGCSVKESASCMGVSAANAKVLQHRALRLAAALNEKAIDGHEV
jgi:RNA polymerase sigma factor (sigma-70 family)